MDNKRFFLELVIPYRKGLNFGDEPVRRGDDYVVLSFNEFKKVAVKDLRPDLCGGLAGYLTALGVPKGKANEAGDAVTKITTGVVGAAPHIYAASWDPNAMIDILLANESFSEVVRLELRLGTAEEVS